LIDYATTFQLHPKTCQKPYAKTPQKTHKNPAKNPNVSGKNLLHGQKLLQSFNNILTKNF
jgi:hypothetical protein